jgi:thiol-disulfide isomerase/thioredoxin
MASDRRAGLGRRRLIGPFTGGQLLAALGVVAATLVILTLITAPIGASTPSIGPAPGATFVVTGTETEGLQPGQRAPELVGQSGGQEVGLVDLDGNPIRLSDFKGRPVWLNFWATWCPPCQQETPVLREVYENHRDEGLALIAISVQETSPEDVSVYVETYDLDYTVGFDATSAVFTAYRAYGLPTQLFIDRDGIIRSVYKGPLTMSQAEQILEPLLRE